MVINITHMHKRSRVLLPLTLELSAEINQTGAVARTPRTQPTESRRFKARYDSSARCPKRHPTSVLLRLFWIWGFPSGNTRTLRQYLSNRSKQRREAAEREARRAPRTTRPTGRTPAASNIARSLGPLEERTVRDRSLLQVQEHEQPIVWKVQFSLGNSSQLSNQCRNSVQGKLLITDELGYICERKDLLVNGCCNVNVPSTKLYSCDSCLPNGCCSVYEYCVSCCLQPNKQHLLERFLNRAAIAFQNLFMAVEDRFELCLAKCRTSSQSVQHENTYRDPIAKYCYGEYPPELLPV
nr:PREDICTED: UPF0454 protein C12orf49 homolog [Struthio camelus australis]